MKTKFQISLLFFCLTLLCALSGFAQFPYRETFKGSTVSDVILDGSAVLTAGSGIDPNGSGYLRLTNNQAYQSGFIRNTQSFPSADGLEISFEYFTYGGSGADGINFFLFDPNASSAFTIGGFGGSLGYSQRSDLSLPGLSKAFIGIAFDEFGNFSNPIQGRVGGPGQRPSSVTLRGDGDGTGSVQPGSIANSNYEYLTSIQTTNSVAMSGIGAGSIFQIAGGQNGRTATGGSLDADEAGYRKARILLEPNGLGTGYKVNVFLRLGTESNERHLIIDHAYFPHSAIPSYLNFGFASSTGGANNFHEIRNLRILVPASTPKSPVLDNVAKSGDEDKPISFALNDFYNPDFGISAYKDPNGDALAKIRISSVPSNGQLKLNGMTLLVNDEVLSSDIQNLIYIPNANFNGADNFNWNAADQGGLYASATAIANITVNPADEVPVAEIFSIRIKLANPTYATYSHAKNPYNKSMVSIFQVDDSPATVYNLMYPYLRGGITAGGFVSPGVKSTDGCGNDLFWNISVACFIHDINGNDLLAQGGNYISWQQLATVTANGLGLQRGFDFMNHGFGGSAVLQKDRYKQIFLNNKAAFENLGFSPESLVVPDTQIGFRFGANTMGMDVISQAGVEPLKDGAVPLAQDEYSEDVYASVQNPYFFRRNHWQETNSAALVNEHKAYILAAYNKSLTKPILYNWFSHGPGETGTSNFTYYRQVIEYLQTLAGDNVIGLSLDQYLGYQKTRYAAENGPAKSVSLSPDGYLEISFDMSGLQKTVRHRLISLLVDSDAQIDSISWSENIKAVTFNPATGLVNIQLNEIIPVDPATLPIRPTIIAGSAKILAEAPDKIRFELDRPINQTIAAAYEVEGNTVLSISEVANSGGLIWEISCQNDFLSTDVVGLTYKAELGNALDSGNGTRMLTYSKLPVINQSTETIPEVEPLAISVRRDSDNVQLATFNTIAEVKAYMSTFNFNTNISIVFNRDTVYTLGSKWTLNYANSNFTLSIKGKDNLPAYPVIDAGGITSDIFRVDMSHVRIDSLKLRSGKYTADGAAFGDNYSGALISQQANTTDTRYTNLILHQGMRGIRIGAANGTNQPNISNVLIDKVVLNELTGIAIQVGIINSVGGQPESRTDASYSLNNVTIRDVIMKDTRNQELIESSGARYSGQIQGRGINNLILQNIVSDQNQKQPFYIVSSKNVLIDRCKATNFSLNTGTGFKAAYHIESSEIITIQNSFAQHTFENVYILGSTRIRLYHNTFDTQQASVRAVSLPDARLILDIQGNIIAAKGDNTFNSCMGISFYRGADYIPTIANDFVSEQNNLFITTSNILEFTGLDAGNTALSIRVAFSTTFANYKSSYSRGQNSVISPYSSLSFRELNGVYGYLGSNSVGRNFVPAQIAGITVDLANNPRIFPSSAGAYDGGELISENLLQLSISEGTLSPVFAAADTNYTASVPNSVGSITFIPVLVDTLSSIQYRLNGGEYVLIGNNSVSDPLALEVGSNIIHIKVSSTGNTKIKIYTLTVTRVGSGFSLDPIPNASINENTPYSGIIPVISGIPYGNLKYTLSGADAFDFSIDHASGLVNMMPANFESPSDANGDNNYELTINATDEGNVKVSRDWMISVTDVQESATFSINAIQDTSINENTTFTGINPVISGQPITARPSRNFTIVPIPDTQFYTGQVNGGNNSIFKSQADWVVRNKNALNIKYLTHLGDCVQNGDAAFAEIEWMRADTSMTIIEDPASTQLPFGIPYGISVGNHDQSPIGDASGTTNFFNQYFGINRFAGRDYYGGHYGTNNDNNYQFFSAGGIDFIAINLEYDPVADSQVLDWADNLLKAYPNRKAIISSHYILKADGSFGPQGQSIYDKLKVNPNLFLMLCGHINPDGETRRTDTFNGNTVHTLLSNYQDRLNGGNGWLRYLEFMPDEGKILVSTYSPTLDRYETDPNSRFVLDYIMPFDTIAGGLSYALGGADATKFTIDPSTGKVNMIPGNFENPTDANNDNVYELRIIATDLDGNQSNEDFKLTLLDVIEPAVFTIDEIDNVTIEENIIFTGLAPVIVGTTIGGLKYSLAGNDSADFAVDSASGIVTMAGKNYYEPADENADNIYEIRLLAHDEDQNSAERAFTVRIIPASPFPYSETFKNSTAAGMILGGNPNAAILTAGTIDANSSGFLRLTSKENNQTGFARNSRLFPSENGLSISFDYYIYGGSGADGLAFFLYDATANPFSIGGFGGSLGYSQNFSNPGISKAFLGLGIDEFGNFSNPTAGRQGGPGQRPSSVALRGDGNGNLANATNYEYLAGIQTTNAVAMANAGAGNVFQIAGGIDGRISGATGILSPGYRSAKINLIPHISGLGFNVNVWITEGTSSGGVVHHLIKDYLYVPTNPIPEFLSYGFSAGTGGKNNFHEVRNLQITLPGQMVETEPIVSDISKTTQANTTLTFTSTDFTSKFSSQENKPLQKIKVISLPLNGALKLSGVNIVANQEIVIADLNQISLVPAPDYVGSTGFQWNGSDGNLYALNPANVSVNIIAQSVLPYFESFRNSTASGLISGGVAALTSGGIDPIGAGYLRLNSNAKNQTGFARNTTSFPSAQGLSISFEYFTYGGSGGDGLSFFLYDATANGTFQIGAPGGSLGYAQNSSSPGLSKAYLGFGFDEFGNFSAATAGRQGGPGLRSSSLTLRGDGNGTGSGSPAGSNYEFLTNIQTTNLAAMNVAGAGPGFTIAGNVSGRTAGSEGLGTSSTGYRKVQIDMKPNGSGTGFILNVWILEGTSSGGFNHHLITDYSYVGNTLPANLSYGFAGSTGGATNFHEIRNLSISLPTPELSVPALMSLRGSFAKSEVIVEPDNEIIPTNFISPNGDAKNDYWVIRNIEKYPNNIVRVFDRLGRLVYSASNYNNAWDGLYQGALLPENTYYYIIELPNGGGQKRGYISIVR